MACLKLAETNWQRFKRGRHYPASFVSDNRSGSGASQLTQRNRRPPVFTRIKCIGFPHLEQVGGGGFFGTGCSR
jgi:hypothetical protein